LASGKRVKVPPIGFDDVGFVDACFLRVGFGIVGVKIRNRSRAERKFNHETDKSHEKRP